MECKWPGKEGGLQTCHNQEKRSHAPSCLPELTPQASHHFISLFYAEFHHCFVCCTVSLSVLKESYNENVLLWLLLLFCHVLGHFCPHRLKEVRGQKHLQNGDSNDVQLLCACPGITQADMAASSQHSSLDVHSVFSFCSVLAFSYKQAAKMEWKLYVSPENVSCPHACCAKARWINNNNNNNNNKAVTCSICTLLY